MSHASYNYKKGLTAMGLCYLLWGFQPLYFAIDPGIDTTFLLACRIVWATVSCLIILKIQGGLPLLADLFRDRRVLLREIPAALLLFADWTIYLFAVRRGKVMECSMGYYIMPLVMFVFGAVLFREKVRWQHFLALAFIVAGIILSTEGFGGIPYVTILLALCFAVYSALKKSLTVDSIVSTTGEILMMLPFALIYLLYFRLHNGAFPALTLGRQLFLMGSGLITGLPMVFFAVGIDHLPLSLIGILQYVSPTLGLICSLILGESFTKEKLVSFLFIWVGVVIYSIFELRGPKHGAADAV